MQFNPYSEGMIRAHIDAELGNNGIIYYPESADVAPKRAAEAQALADYNNAGRSPRHREEMAAIYGDLYKKELDGWRDSRSLRAGRYRGGKEVNLGKHAVLN